MLGPTRVLNPNDISIGSTGFAGLSTVTDRQTDRQTDHATRSVTIGRRLSTHVVLQCGLIIISGQSNLTTGRIAAAHVRFNGIRQVA